MSASTELERAAILARELASREKFWQINVFEPYLWQKKLANATVDCNQVLAMCANQIGKTTTGAYITACHLTGRYPKWWTGHKFKEPIAAWAAGVSNESTRDILQTNLFGPPEDSTQRGTAMIPKEDIHEVTRKPQIPNAIQSGLIAHHDPDTGEFNGYSRLAFKTYEQGEEKFMGVPLDWIWLDEQPSSKIYTQCITRTAATKGYVLMTFTPEDGMTPVVKQFMNDRKPGQHLLRATWDDAPHLDEEHKAQLLAQYRPHEADMRSKGIPVFGSGMVFPVDADSIKVDAFEIPKHWRCIAGLDLGWEHPAAVVWIAWDSEADVYYVYDCHRGKHLTIAEHSLIINQKPVVPVSWPHDGHKHERGSGDTAAQQYRDNGVDMLLDHFTNPPVDGKDKGDIRVEPGISWLLDLMRQGKFKVFSHLHEWFEEFTGYHRDDGKIVDLDDDLMSATRYGAVALTRFGAVRKDTADSFGGNIDYPDLGIV